MHELSLVISCSVFIGNKPTNKCAEFSDTLTLHLLVGPIRDYEYYMNISQSLLANFRMWGCEWTNC